MANYYAQDTSGLLEQAAKLGAKRGEILASGLTGSVNAFRQAGKLNRQASADAENLRRWNITNQRAEDKEARLAADREAENKYLEASGRQGMKVTDFKALDAHRDKFFTDKGIDPTKGEEAWLEGSTDDAKIQKAVAEYEALSGTGTKDKVLQGATVGGRAGQALAKDVLAKTYSIGKGTSKTAVGDRDKLDVMRALQAADTKKQEEALSNARLELAKVGVDPKAKAKYDKDIAKYRSDIRGKINKLNKDVVESGGYGLTSKQIDKMVLDAETAGLDKTQIEIAPGKEPWLGFNTKAKIEMGKGGAGFVPQEPKASNKAENALVASAKRRLEEAKEKERSFSHAGIQSDIAKKLAGLGTTKVENDKVVPDGGKDDWNWDNNELARYDKIDESAENKALMKGGNGSTEELPDTVSGLTETINSGELEGIKLKEAKDKLVNTIKNGGSKQVITGATFKVLEDITADKKREDTIKEIANNGEILKRHINPAGGNKLMSDENIAQWAAIGNVASTTIGTGAGYLARPFESIYNYYQNSIGQPFRKFIENPPGGPTPSMQKNPDYVPPGEVVTPKRLAKPYKSDYNWLSKHLESTNNITNPTSGYSQAPSTANMPVSITKAARPIPKVERLAEVHKSKGSWWDEYMPRSTNNSTVPVVGGTTSSVQAPDSIERDKVLNKIITANNVAETTTDSNIYRAAVKQVESGGEKQPYMAVNSDSGALGAYQMLPSTLDDYRSKLGNPTNKEFLASPGLQEKAFELHTAQVTKYLGSKGVAVTPLSLWVGHNLGQGNAVKLFTGKVDNNLTKAIKVNLPEGIEPTPSNYIKYYRDKFE